MSRSRVFCSLPAWTVMWLDPGKVTGVASYDSAGNFWSAEDEFEELVLLLDWKVRTGGPSFRISWERFDITPATYRLPGAGIALEVIGAARAAATLGHCTILRPSVRSARNSCPAEMLKAMGWHRPGKPHANDAARHLAVHLITAGGLDKGTHDRIRSFTEERGDVSAVRGPARG